MEEQIDEQTIAISIKEAEDSVAFGDAINRLKTNKDFITVVMEGYLKDEAIRLVHAKAETSLLDNLAAQQAILVGIDSIGAFLNYLNTKLWQADQATRALQEYNEMLAEVNGMSEDSVII